MDNSLISKHLRSCYLPHSLLLSLFFKTDNPFNPAKSNAWHTFCWCSASLCLMAVNVTANDKLFYASLQKIFHAHVFAHLTHE